MRHPDEEQPRLERFVHRFARVSYAISRDLMQGTLTLHAMSLVFTTMLAIVPLVAITVSLLRYFNVQDRFLPMLEHLLLPMGQKGQQMHDAIIKVVDELNVGVLGVVGLLMLFYLVISLVQKVEHALNQIWYVANTRSVSRRFTNFISVVIVGPVLVISAVSLVSGFLESPEVSEVLAIKPLGVLFLILTDMMPSLVLIVAFSCFYVMVPNTRVSAGCALAGAVVASIAWQIAGTAFTAFVASSARYDLIYSGFAVGIVALLWLYTSWLILLLGSSVAFYIQNDNYITRTIHVKGSPSQLEELALRIMLDIARHQEQKGEPIKQAKLESMPGISGLLVRQVVEVLLKGRLIIDAGEGGESFVLTRSSDLVTVADILTLVRREGLRHISGLPEPVIEISRSIDEFIYKEFNEVTVRDMMGE